jgi:hypothetical protein
LGDQQNEFSNDTENEVWTTAKSETISKVKKLKGGTKGPDSTETSNLDEEEVKRTF